MTLEARVKAKMKLLYPQDDKLDTQHKAGTVILNIWEGNLRLKESNPKKIPADKIREFMSNFDKGQVVMAISLLERWENEGVREEVLSEQRREQELEEEIQKGTGGEKEVLNLKEASILLGISREGLSEMSREKKIPCQRCGGYKYSRQGLINWLSSGSKWVAEKDLKKVKDVRIQEKAKK